MADQVFRSLPAVTAAPADFVVPNAAEWALKVITATYDGTAAATSFLPAVQIVGPGGVVAATFADKNVSVAAGGSAEVTFGPFLKGIGGGGGGITQITSTDGSIIVTNATGPITNLAGFKPLTAYEYLSSNTMTVTNGGSGTFTWSHANGSSLWDLTSTSTPKAKVQGMWAVVFGVSVTANFTAGGNALFTASIGDGGVSSQSVSTLITDVAPVSPPACALTLVHFMSTSAVFSGGIYNNDGAVSRDFTCQAYTVRIT